MFQVAKVCVTAVSGLVVCSTAPAWATVAVAVVVTAGTVAVLKES